MIKSTRKGFILKLKVQPGARKNEVAGTWLDSLKVRVTSPPEAGKANKACIGLLAKQLGIPKSNINIVIGHTSREKQVCICGLSKKDLLVKLGLPPADLLPTGKSNRRDKPIHLFRRGKDEW